MTELRKVEIVISGPRAIGKSLIADIITKALHESEKPVKVQNIKQYDSGTKEVLEVTFSTSF